MQANSFVRSAWALGLSLLLAVATAMPARAQTTDGYHSIQVFPVVVDTASFTQRFNFRNPSGVTLTIVPHYVPAIGTTQATAFDCPSFNIVGNKTASFNSLRDMCPALASGSQYGFLYLSPSSFVVLPYAGFSRVSNPQGNGFSVEAFPASAFTSADSVVNGLRRLAATPSSPAFQTNCFFGLLNNLDDLPLHDTPINYTLYNSAGVQIGQGQQTLIPGKIIRLLDIFVNAGAATGDYDNAMLKIVENGPDEPGVIAFCTVQDNTSFGADFRIAKQEVADGLDDAIGGPTVGAQSAMGRREMLRSQDASGRVFTIPAGNGSNTHVVRLHAADYGFCEIIDPNTNQRALATYGLEIRAVDPQSGETGAGGNNSTIVPDPAVGSQTLYLGDRADGTDGDDKTAIIEVESNEQNTGVPRPYKLHCRSGSGMSGMDIIRYQEPVDRF